MPRLTKSLPKYRKHRASGQAVVTLNGKDHYLGPHGTKASRLEYDRLVGEWAQNGRRLSTSHTGCLTVVELIAAYWRFAKSFYVKDGQPTGEQPGIKAAMKVLRDSYGPTRVDEFGPLSLKAVRQRMIDRGNSRKYVNKNVGRIRRAFKWGVENELVPVAVYQSLATVAGLKKGKTPAKDFEPVGPVGDDVVERTLPHLRPKLVAMVQLQRLLGCRPGELCEMKASDVDRSGDVWQYVPRRHKTEHHGRSRVILIGPRAQQVLTPWLLRAGDGYCFPPRGKRDTYHMTERCYRSTIHRACDVAFPAPEPIGRRAKETIKKWQARLTAEQRQELEKWQASHRWSPNQLRHTAATEIRRKFGLEAAQVILGHASADVTQVYAERDMRLAEDVIREVG
ncbi:MAG: tyrosine-type recombinase/integrase [Pirellulaceae bacterium]